MHLIVVIQTSLLLLDLNFFVEAKEPGTHNGGDEGNWTVVNGGDHTTQGQILNPNSDNQCTHQTEAQDDLRTSSETANGVIDSNEGQTSQHVDN